MLPEHYIAQQIADASTLSANEALEVATKPHGTLAFEPMKEDYLGWNPAGTAVEQGKEAIVLQVQAQDKRNAEAKQVGRFAAAVAEAMNPVQVGKINSEGKVEGVRLEDPKTLPESKSTIQAGIKAVGAGGRKGVFSELPFDAEDVPAGWDVVQTEDGGWLANPKENTDEVLENERTGKRHETLGYVAKKKESDDRVVQVKDAEDNTVQDVSTDAKDFGSVIDQALDVAGQIGGYTDVVSPGVALEQRTQETKKGLSEEIFNSFATVEGNRPKVYKDSQGLRTVGIGFNMEQKGAQGVWEAAGVTQSFNDVINGTASLTEESTRKLLGHTIGRAQGLAVSRAEDLGVDWKGLPAWHKAILTDIAFNTGNVSGWTKVFKSTNKKAVLRQARRLEGGKHTVGMDNRVARIGLELGIINSVAQARQLGLKLTNLTESEVKTLTNRTDKAQPTATVGVRG